MVNSSEVKHVDGQERTKVGKSTLEIRVVDPAGIPIPGAYCLWRMLPPEDLSGLYVWGLSDSETAGLHGLLSITDQTGVANFSAPLFAIDRQTLLWIWADHCAAEWTIIPPGVNGDGVQRTIMLSKHQPLQITVVGEGDLPVNNAIVHVVGLRPRVESELPELARRAFRGSHREFQTSMNGKVAVAPLQGSHVVWATQGNRMSVPFLDIGASAGTLLLTLEETFIASGFVDNLDASQYLDSLQVTAYAWRGADSVRASQARVLEDGTINPFRVPLFATDGYDFVVRGGPWLPTSDSCAPPQPNEHVTLRFTLKTGQTIRVKVVDENRKPIAGAKVIGEWENEGGGAQVALTNDNGVASVLGVHPSSVQVRITAAGFISAHVVNVSVADHVNDPLEVVLRKGGKLSGKVVRGNRPQSQFSIVYWEPSKPASRTEIAFQATSNGDFELDGLPLGDLLIFASSAECPRSEVEGVEIEPEIISRVTLDLPEPLVGVGLVVDSLSGLPVSGATVQLWNSYRAGYLSPFGALHPVDIDGRFEISGFAPGDSRFVIRADGYAQHLGQAHGIIGERLELGIVALHRNQRLTVRLTSPSSIDFTQYEADADGNMPYPTQRFSTDGIVVWPEAGPNVYFVRVYLPNGSRMFHERYCPPGEDWEFVFPLDYSSSVQVAVNGEDGNPWTHPLDVRLTYVSTGGHRLVHANRAMDGLVTFKTVATRTAYIEALNDVGQCLASTQCELQPGHNQVQLVVGGRQLRVRVVGPEGQPLVGASLDARMAAGESPWFRLTSTDAAGMHTFTGLGMKKLFINVQHNEFGVRSDVEVDLETWKDEEVLEIELDPSSTIGVRLVDGKEPVAAANLRILGPASHHILGVFTTDSNGLVRYGPVTAGSYLVSVEQPGIWPTQQLIAAGAKDQHQDLQVRRLGDLALSIEAGPGQPAPGIRVELEFAESGDKLSEWIERGLVDVGTPVVATDAAGEALVRRIPHGEYLVRLSGPSGSWNAGRILVRPGNAPTRVVLTVP